MRRQISARNLSSPVRADSGSRGSAGRKWRRLVGLEGLRGSVWAAVGAGGPIVVIGVPCLVPARPCSAGAWRQRNERGAFRALVAGPMASCASIDIEDATQHLRDILKLDRPAGGEPGQRGGSSPRGRRAARAGLALRACRSPPPPGPALHPPDGCGKTMVRAVIP